MHHFEWCKLFNLMMYVQFFPEFYFSDSDRQNNDKSFLDLKQFCTHT